MRPTYRRGYDASRTAQRGDIAEQKLPDLNAVDIEAAMRTVAGTARSMGVSIEDG